MFDTEEAGVYAADLDAKDEEAHMLEATCGATRLREKLREDPSPMICERSRCLRF
jgi:hypothetical protein